jgi:hypothetical protein
MKNNSGTLLFSTPGGAVIKRRCERCGSLRRDVKYFYQWAQRLRSGRHVLADKPKISKDMF